MLLAAMVNIGPDSLIVRLAEKRQKTESVSLSTAARRRPPLLPAQNRSSQAVRAVVHRQFCGP